MSEASEPLDLIISDLPLPEVIGYLLRLNESDPRSSAAATEILRRFQPLLRKYWAWHRLGEYEDFVQEAMLRLFIALPSLRNLDSFPGLFRRIVIGTAADALRARVESAADVEDLNDEQLAVEFDESLSTGVVVRSYLEHLPPREREVINLTFFEDLDPAEVAVRLNLSEGAVRMTKSRAIGRLRTILGQDTKKPGIDDAQ